MKNYLPLKKEPIERIITKIFEAALDTVDRDWLIEKISTFDSCETDMDVIGVLQDIIPTYTPNHNI